MEVVLTSFFCIYYDLTIVQPSNSFLHIVIIYWCLHFFSHNTLSVVASWIFTTFLLSSVKSVIFLSSIVIISFLYFKNISKGNLCNEGVLHDNNEQLHFEQNHFYHILQSKAIHG